MTNSADISLGWDGSVRWWVNNRYVVITEIIAQCAMVDYAKNLLFVLEQGQPYASALYIYNSQGKRIQSLRAPTPFDLYYLTEHPDYGITVVCGSEKKINGWQDWHFLISSYSKWLITGLIQRLGCRIHMSRHLCA